MAHPDSAALRELADLLDASQITKSGNLYVTFHSVPKDQTRPMMKALGMNCPKPKDGEKYGSIGMREFGKVNVTIYGNYADVCTPRTIMREVTVWDCDCADEPQS